MTATTRAKLVCNAKYDDDQGNTIVSLVAVMAPFGTTNENSAFASATPSANFTMLIAKGRPAADNFLQGAEYYVDITEAVPAPAEPADAPVWKDPRGEDTAI